MKPSREAHHPVGEVCLLVSGVSQWALAGVHRETPDTLTGEHA